MDPEDLVASSVNDPDKDDDKSESITVEKDNPPAGRQREIVLKPLSVKLHQLSSAQVEDLKESLRQSGYRDIRKSSVEKDLTDEGSDSQSEGSDSEKNRKRKCELTDEGIPVKKSRPEEGGKAVKPTKQDDALRQSSYSSSKTKETGSKTLTAPKKDDLRDKTPSKTEKTDIKKYKPAKILEKGQKRPISRPTTSGEGIGRSASASWDDLEKRLMFFMKMEAVQRKHDVGSDQSNESSLGKIKKKSESDRLIFQSPIMSAPQPEEDRERSWSSGYDNRQSSEKRGGHRGRFKRRGHGGNRGDRNRQQERRKSDQKERSRSLSSSRTPQDDGEDFDYGVGADDSDDNGIESSSGKLGDSSAEDILTEESSGALFQDNILDILEQLQPVSTDYSQHGGDDGGNEPAPKKMKMDEDNSMTDSCDLCGVQYSGEQRRQEHIDGNGHGRHFVLMLENLGKEMFADRYPDVVPGKAGEELLKKRQDSTSVAEDYDPGEDIEELNAIGVKSNQSVVGNLGEVGRKLLTAWRTTSELNLTDEEKDELLINLVKLIRVQPTLGVSNIRMAVTGFAESNDIKQVAKPAEQQEPAVIDFEFAFSCLLTDIMNSASFTSDKQKIKGLAKVHFDKMANKSLDSLAPYMKTSMMLRIKGKEDKASASAQFDINLRIAKLLISLNVSMDEKDSMFTYLKKRMEDKLNPTELKALAEKELQELKFTSEIQSGSAKEQIEKLQEAWGIIDEIIVISDDKDKFMVHVLKKLGETPKLDITALLKQAAAEFGMNHNSRVEETAPCTTFDFIFMCLFTGMDVNREEKNRIRGLAKSHYEKDPDMPLERFVSYVKTSTLLKKKGKEEKERVSKQFDWNLKITRLLIDLQVDVQRKDEMYKFLMDGMVRGVHPDKLRTSAEQRLQESRADQSPQFGVGRSISRDEQDSSVQSSKPAATRKDSVSRSSNNGKVKSPDSNVPVKEADGTSVSRDQIQSAKPTDTETSKTSNGREGQKPLDVKDSQPLAQKQTDVNTRPNLKAMDQETKDINRTPVSGSVPQKQPDAKTTPVSKPAQQKVTDVKTPPVSKPTQQKITDVKVSPVSKPVQHKPVDVKTTPVSKPTQQKIADVKATPPSKPIQCNTTDAKTTPVLKQTPPKATGAKPSVSKSTDAKTTPGSKSTPQKQGEVQATPVLESTQQKPTVIPKPPQQKPAGTKSTPQKAADSNTTPVSKQTPQKSTVVTSTSVSETKQEKITDTKTTAVSVAAQQKATSIKIIPVSKTTPQKSADVKTTPVSKPVPQKPTDAKTKPLSKPIQKQEEAKTGSKPPQENPTSIKLTTASESLPQKLADAKTTPISKPTDAKTPPVSKLAQQKLTEVQTTQISKSAQQKPTDIKAEPVPKPAQQKAVSVKIAVPQQKAASVKIISPKAASVKIVAPQQKAAGAQTASNSKSNQQKTEDSKSRKSFEMNFEYIFICLLSDVVIDQKERERIEKLSKAQYNKTPKGMPLEQFCSYVKTSTLFKKAKDEKERLSAQFDLNLKITKLLIELKVGLNLKDKMYSFLKENIQKKTRPDQLKSQAVKYLKELTTISGKQAVQSSKSSDIHDEQHPDLSAKCVQVKQSEEKKKEITKSVSTGNIPPWKQENQSSTKNSSGAEKKLPTAEHTEKLQAALKAACTIMNEIKAKKNDADHTKAHPQANKSEVTEKSPVKKSQTGTSDATKSHEVTEKSPVKKSQTGSSDVNKKSDVEGTQMESVEKPHLDWREFDYIISSLFTDINLSDEVKEQIRKLAEPVFEKNKLSLAIFYSYVKASTLLRKKVQKEKEQAGEQFDLNLKITRLLMRNRVEAEYREEMYRFFKDSVQKGISQKKIKPDARKHMLILKGEQSEVTQGNADTEKVDQGSSGAGTDSSEGEKKALTTKQQQKPQQQITCNSSGAEKKLLTAERTEKLQVALKAACTIMNEMKAKKNDADNTKANPQANKSEVTEKSPVKKSQTGTSDATKSHEVTEKSSVKKSQTGTSDVNKKSDVEGTQMESVEKPHLDWREFDYIISSLFTDINLSDEVKEQIRKLAEPVFEKNKLSLAIFYSYVKASTLLRKKVQKEKEQAGEQFDLNLKITRLLMRNRVEAEYREEMYRFFKDSVQKGISQKKIKPGARKHMLILKGEQSEVTQGNADTEKVDEGSSGAGTDSSEGEKKALTTKQQQKPQQQITCNSSGAEKKLPTAEHTEKLQVALKAACTIMNKMKAKKNDADHTKAHPQANKSEVTEKSPVKKSQTGTSDVNKKSDVEGTQMESVEKPHLDWREFDYIISSLFTDINLSDEVKEQIRKLAEPVFEKNKLSLAVFFSYVKASTLLGKKVQKEKEQAGEQFDLNLKITRLLMRNRVEAEYREEMYRFFKDSVQKGISQKKIKPGARKHMLILKGEQSEVTQGNADTEKVDQGSSGAGTDSSEGEKKALTTKQQQKPQQQITKKNSTGKESTVKSLMKQKMKTNTTQQNSGQKGRFSQYASGVRRPPPGGMQRTSGSIQNPFSNILNPSGSRQNPSHSMLRPSGGTLSLSGAIRNPSDGLHAFGTHSSRIQEFRGFSVRQPGASVSLYDSDLRKPDVDFRIRQEATLSGDWQGGFMQNQQHEKELLSRGLLDSFYPEEQEPRRAWPGPGYGMQSHQYQRY